RQPIASREATQLDTAGQNGPPSRLSIPRIAAPNQRFLNWHAGCLGAWYANHQSTHRRQNQRCHQGRARRAAATGRRSEAQDQLGQQRREGRLGRSRVEAGELVVGHSTRRQAVEARDPSRGAIPAWRPTRVLDLVLWLVAAAPTLLRL